MAEEKQNEKKINRCVCGRINDLNGISYLNFTEKI